MYRFSTIKATCGAVVLLTFYLLLPYSDASTVEVREPLPKRIHEPGAKSPIATAIDTKAKLTSFNRALNERLQHTQAALRPLQARAVKLQRRYLAVPTSPRRKSERNELLQEALRLRAAVERKLIGFGTLDRSYRNLRMAVVPQKQMKTSPTGPAPPLKRAWIDRDTERQMELNERIYKNIIDLMVHLIECPVNIIHEIMGANGSPASSTPTTVEPDYAEDDPALLDDEATNQLYDVDDTDGVGEVSEPWLEEFHY